MGARELLHELAAAGIEVAVVGDKLRVRPWSRVSERHRQDLRDHKAEVIGLLAAPPADPAGADDLAAREAFHERAGILEFGAGLPRHEAERQAADILMRDGVPIPRHVAEAIAHGLLPKNWRATP